MDIINFRVSPIGDALEIWVEVPDGPNYDNIEINEIAISDHNHYTNNTYPVAPQARLTFTTNTSPSSFEFTNRKKVIKRISFKDLKTFGLDNTGMFFLYIKQSGVAEEGTPCLCNKTVTIGVATNLYPIYNKTIKLLNDYENSCSDNRAKLIDIYLKKQMFLEAVVLEEYETAIDIFNSILFMEIKEGDCYNGCNPSYNNSHGTLKASYGCKTCS